MFIKLTLLLLTCASLFAEDKPSFAARKEIVRTMLDKGEFLRAQEQAKILNREIPDDISAYQLLAASELGLGDYDKAERTIQWMLDLRIGKSDAAGWLLVAQFREATGDLDGAIDAVNLSYSRVVAGRQPDAQRLLIYSAQLQMLSGKLDNAEKILQSSPATQPGGEKPLAALAQLRILQHRQSDAKDILNKLILSGSHPKYLYELALLTEKPTDFAAFESAAMPLRDKSDNANRELILYYSGPGNKPAEALKLAQREMAKRHDVLTLDSMAIALYESGKTVEAREIIARILAIGTRDPDVLRHAARLGVSAK